MNGPSRLLSLDGPFIWCHLVRAGRPSKVATVSDLVITSVEAVACSVPLKHAVTQGLGQAVTRDAVLVKVTTAGGRTGYGESYNGRAPLAVAQTVNTTLRDLFAGMDASQTIAVWDRFESRLLASHGTGAACVCAMSGIDMALFIGEHPLTEGPAWR
jgi:D-galactarolactone cycloisomerase